LRHDALFREIVDTPKKELQTGAYPRTVVNRNTLVLEVPWVNGVKTGRTLEAGYVLVSSGKRKGVEFVAAVLGAPSEADRDAASLELLSYGGSLYHRRTAIEDGALLRSAAIRYRDEALPLVAKGDFAVTARKDQDLVVNTDAPSEVEGPIERGEQLGVARVSLDGEVVGQVPLVADEQVDAPTLIEKADDAFPGGRAALWLAAVLAVVLAVVVARALPRPRSL
jgi:D-alanyl-D-alanine carboxypeptidase (penicillin-binding protein 5/6)